MPSHAAASSCVFVCQVCQILLVAVVQLWAYFDVQRQPWFIPYMPAAPGQADNFASHENFAVYTASSFQYIWLVLVFSRGEPFRRRLHTNVWFSVSIVVNVAFCAWCLLWPADWLAGWLELLVPPSVGWRCTLAGVVVAQLLLALLAEYGLVEALVTRRLLPRSVSLPHPQTSGHGERGPRIPISDHWGRETENYPTTAALESMRHFGAK